MFLGHFAVGLALKRATPRTSLGWLIAAPQLPDLLWPAFLLLGWEHVRIEPGNTAVTPLAFDSYPWSHSLVMTVVWGVLLGAIYFSRHRMRAAAIWLALAVVSHWVLDWVTHRPDMPLVPGEPAKVGLGLWNSVGGTVAVETAMFAAAVWLYTRTTRARDAIGRFSFWAFVAFLAVVYVGNLFGTPPPSTTAIGVVGLALWVFPFWAAWFDRHRAAIGR